MKRFAFVLVTMTVLGASCGKKEPLPGISDTTQMVQTQTNGDAVNKVASDKELLRQALVLADSKGTLESALTEAAQDSLVGIRMRVALILGNEAKQKTTAPPGKGHSGGEKKTSQNGNILDKTNAALDKTNQTVDKTVEATAKARAASQKTHDLLDGNK